MGCLTTIIDMEYRTQPKTPNKHHCQSRTITPSLFCNKIVSSIIFLLILIKTMATTVRTSRNSSNTFSKFWKKNSNNILPPILGILGFLILWQILSPIDQGGLLGLIKLPPPSSLITNERTRTYLFYPFFDRGGTDVGLFWQSMASLQRVLIGYLLAAFVGISLGIDRKSTRLNSSHSSVSRMPSSA